MIVTVCYTKFCEENVEIPDNIVLQGGKELKDAAIEAISEKDVTNTFITNVFDANPEEEICYGQW